MKTKSAPLARIGAVIALLLLAAPLTDAFSYQGVLSQNGSNAQGQFEMTFQLLESGTATPVGNPIDKTVVVSDGLFQVDLAFDPLLFDGTVYDLQISVSNPDGPIFVLSPPTQLSATPQAIFANSVGSVPDAALGGNVARLDQPAVFITSVSMPQVRVSDAVGGGRLIFGPTDDCTIGIDPSGPSGLLLGDPAGIRILSPDPTQSSRLIFGPTDDCTIGIDPNGVNTGLVVFEDFGFRIASASPNGVSRLLFGPGTDANCAIIVDSDPAGTRGMQILEEFGVRIRNPQTGGAARLIFGDDPDDLCMVSVEPSVASGLLLRDPAGVRILSPDPTQSSRLIFGPTDDCTIGIDPNGVNTGLVVFEDFGFRIASASPDGVSRLLLGPGTDANCAIIVDPNPNGIRGMQILEEFGVRIRNPQTGGAARLTFGDDPDDLCMVSVEPSVAPGLLLRDPAGIRILPVDPLSPPSLIFGPTDDCRLGIDPSGTMRGLIAYEPNGVRLIDELNAKPSLIFGPTDECRIRVADDGAGGPPRLTLDDVNGFLFTNNVEVQGSVSAQQFIQTSTRRLKENIKPIENPLEVIQQLQGVRYDWKEEQGGKADIGFIAEDVGKVFPEIVAWEEDGINARGLNYGHLVAVAVEGIKAQQVEIETLRSEKAEMEVRLARLEALLLNNTQAE